MSDLTDRYAIVHLKDDVYQLVNKYNDEVVEQGNYEKLLAYIKLEDMGLI
jgi:sulfur relay (sulfurtransferase) DsrF/TusC family protein